MPPRPRKTAPAPAMPPTGLLDWQASRHWSEHARPCRYCGTPTHLLDEKGLPAEKACAERVWAEIAHIVQVHATQGLL